MLATYRAKTASGCCALWSFIPPSILWKGSSHIWKGCWFPFSRSQPEACRNWDRCCTHSLSSRWVGLLNLITKMSSRRKSGIYFQIPICYITILKTGSHCLFIFPFAFRVVLLFLEQAMLLLHPDPLLNNSVKPVWFRAHTEAAM